VPDFPIYLLKNKTMEILFNTIFMTAFCIGIFLSGAFFVGLLFRKHSESGAGMGKTSLVKNQETYISATTDV
jgi:hypothetical protein